MLSRTIRGRGFGASCLLEGAIVALIFSCALVCAVEPGAAARHRIDQPFQALAGSLRAIARQTGTSIIFDPGKGQGTGAGPKSPEFFGTKAAIQASELCGPAEHRRRY